MSVVLCIEINEFGEEILECVGDNLLELVKQLQHFGVVTEFNEPHAVRELLPNIWMSAEGAQDGGFACATHADESYGVIVWVIGQECVLGLAFWSAGVSGKV